ncbi:MAG: YraN family protein [Candidatus Omnitrophota bacterium]|jgi:putative endonuclease
MPGSNVHTGRQGEEAARDFLKKNGYRILQSNYRTRSGEIDIIARDKDTLCFVEVKTRNSQAFGSPCEAVMESKQRTISFVAAYYLKEHNLLDTKARFDIVSVVRESGQARCELIKNAFEFLYDD